MAITFDHTPFATVLGDHQIEGPWRDWLVAKLAETGLRLDEEDRLWRGESMFGFGLLADLPAAAAEPQLAPLLDRPPRPWVGRPAGVFAWSHTGDPDDAKNGLIPALIRLGRGPFVRLDGKSDEVLESFRLRRFPLSMLDKRHGFDDGDDLLRDPDYLEEARKRADAALREAGFEGMVGIWPTHHNPLKLSTELKRDGQVVANAESALDDHSFEIWALDWDILSRNDFWME